MICDGGCNAEGKAESTAFWLCLFVATFLAAVPAVFKETVNHDVAYILTTSGRLLDGARLYVDIFDNNPPLIYWLSAVPVWLAKLAQVSVITVFRVLVLGSIAGSLALCHRFLEVIGTGATREIRRCCILALFFLLALLPQYDFGQREHLLVILTLPYLLGSVARSGGYEFHGGLRFSVSVLAALGFALKPIFLPVWLATEIYVAWRRRQVRLWSPEAAGFALTLAVYAAAVLIFTPALFTNLPPAVRYYAFLNSPWSRVIFTAETAICVSAFAACLVNRPAGGKRDFLRILLIATGASLLGAFVQHKGWAYHYYPATVNAVLILVVTGADPGGGNERRTATARALVAFAAVGFCLAYVSFAVSMSQVLNVALIRSAIATLAVAVLIRLRARAVLVASVVTALAGVQALWIANIASSHDHPLVTTLVQLVKRHAPGKPIMALATSDYPAFPTVNYSGARWSAHFAGYWPLPAIYAGASASGGDFPFHRFESMSSFEKYLVGSVVDDMRAHPPALVIVDESPCKYLFRKVQPSACPEQFGQFDYLRYFSRDPRFAALWAEYEFLADLGPYNNLGPYNGKGPYRVYQRRNPAAAAQLRRQPGTAGAARKTDLWTIGMDVKTNEPPE